MRSSLSPIVGLLWMTSLLGCPSGPPSSDASKQAQTEPKTEPAKPPTRRADKPVLPPLPDDVVAHVGDREITRAEFDARYDPVAAAILARRTDGKVPEPFQAAQREQILDKLIWSKLLELEAERSKVDFTPEQLAEYETNERRHIRDWPAWLARIGQSVEIRHQANVDYLRERALLEARVGPLAPTDEELRAAYEARREQLVATEEMVRSAHVQLAYGPRVADEKIQPPTAEQTKAATPEQKVEWEAAAKLRAEQLRTLALAPGVDFHEFAREWSEGPGAFRGEDMGLFPRRQMVLDYSDAVFALEPGQLSQPVRSELGYYVIKSFGRFPAGPLPFEAVRDDLVRELEAAKYKQARAALELELGGRFTVESVVRDQAREFRAARGR